MPHDPDDSHARQRRLEEALRVWLERASSGPDALDDRAWLAEHPELADLLAPMLESDTSEPSGPARTRIDDFEIVRELGRGGMGVVYEAEQVTLRRRVALKVLPPGFAANPVAVVRFRREARAVAALDHPAIVKIHTVGDGTDQCFQAMELVEGASLAAILETLRRQPGPPRSGHAYLSAIPGHAIPADWPSEPARACVRLILPIAEALAHAAARGILHRDVKPANILVRTDGRALLTDFGLAHQDDQPLLSDTGAIAGTPHYVAPERIRGGAPIDERADVFSLGVTLHEMLTLRRPFDGATPAAVLDAICTREADAVHRVDPGLDRGVSAIVAKMLEKDPARRYASAAACADDLRAWLAHRPIAARPVTSMGRVVRWARRERTKAVLLGGALATGLVAISALWLFANSAKERGAGSAVLLAQQLDEALCDAYAELSEGTPERAARLVAAALELDPDSPEALACAVLLALRRNAAEEAAKLLVAHPRPAGDPALRLLAQRVHTKLGDTARADALQAGPPKEGARRSPLELFVLGQFELALGHAGEAPAFARATELLAGAVHATDRAKPLYWFELAHACGHAGDRGRAADVETALGTLWPDSARAAFWCGFAHHRFAREKAAERIRQALAQRPDWAIAWSNYGLVAMYEQDYRTAAEAFTRCLALRPELETTRAALVDALLRAGDPAAARATLEGLLATSPRNPRHLALQARLQHVDGNPSEARRMADQALEIDPGCVDARVVRAQVRSTLGDLAGARQDFESAAKSDPGSAGIWFELGIARGKLGEADAAIAAYEKAIALDPRRPQPRVNLANLLVARKEFATAETHVDAALLVKPDLVQARLTKLRLQGEHGGDAAMLEYARLWAKESPTEPEGHLQLARVLLEPFAKSVRSGLDPEAVPMLEEALAAAARAVATSKDAGPALWARGEALLHLGRISEALDSLERASLALVDAKPTTAYYKALTDHALEIARRRSSRPRGGP